MVRNLKPEKRANYLSSALKLLVANGVQNTSTAEIAKEAGTAAGTLFLYFPTKQDLLDALVLKIGQEQSDRINALLEPSLSARDTFFTIWNGSVRWFLENMEAYLYIQQVRDTGIISDATVQETNKFFLYY
jgi:AcrR family transcriptional regulator